jgi:hypothetical protein
MKTLIRFLSIGVLAALVWSTGIAPLKAQSLVVPSTSSRGSTGASPFHLVAANTNNSTLLKNGTGTVYSIQVGGIGAAPAYLKFYDKATAPTCGTDTPKKVVMIPAAATAANGSAREVAPPLGVNFINGIGICVVTGIADSDNTAVAASTFIVDIDYR